MKIYSKKIGILVALYLCCYSLPAQKTTCPVDKSDYQLVWQDEFDQDGTPNPDFWTYENGFVRNHEAQWYQPQNATIRDGVLVITGKRETKPNPNYRKGAANWQENRENIEYTSASVITKGLKEFQYGYFEIRARIPACRGSWPAIWLLGSKGKYGWPSCGEIDIMEYYPRNGQNLLHANACWGGRRWQERLGQCPRTLFRIYPARYRMGLLLSRMEYGLDRKIYPPLSGR